jgi:membrane associated rhomboid family serine protease
MVSALERSALAARCVSCLFLLAAWEGCATSMKKIKKAAVPILVLVGVMWVIEFVNWSSGHSFTHFGIVPRTADGLAGIPLAPFLHGSVAHMASNTVPLLILGGLVALSGAGRLLSTTVVVAILGGFGVWLMGRPAVHIGASILIFGYFGYLLALALYERSVRSAVLAVITLVLYSGMIWGVLPQERHISWEGHLFGFLGGIAAARLMRKSRSR